MIFARRDRRSNRFTTLQVACFFLAAGVWLSGVITGRTWLTAAAIVIVVLAMILGLLGRSRDAEEAWEDGEEEEEPQS